MIEAKLQLLSILSNHTADRQPHDATTSPDVVAARDKALHTSEYTEMFYLVANDVMNTLYVSEEDLESTGDPMADLEAACEDAGIDYNALLGHPDTYLNLLVSSGKIESDTRKKLQCLYEKATKPGDED